MADLGIVNSQIAVWNILYLVEVFAFPTNFKQVFSVNKEVTCLRIAHFMPLRQLIEKEGLTNSACVNFGCQGKHQPTDVGKS